ncbi:MAG TPA: hypothetical protein VMX56_00870 [Anaerolineales bacterium]|nr:hypothetical protein [Anaerolineales bacterium]
MIHRLITALTIWLMVCCSVLALDWPEQVEVGSLLVLDAPEGAACAWGISATDIDGATYDPVFREFPGALAVETRYGGVLSVVLKTDAKRGLSEIHWSIGVGDAEPQPDPGPDPQPPPVVGRIFAVLVEETENRAACTPEQRLALVTTADLDYMRGKGYLYRKVDQDVVEPDGQGGDRVPLDIASFLQRADGQPLPRLIIADERGGILHDAVITDEAGVLRTLKQYGGE